MLRPSTPSDLCVLAGPCGFAEAQARLFREFDILEVQQTFYQPPKVSTAQRWRNLAPESFVFTLKAWQLLTELSLVGSFRWNHVTRMTWTRTLAIAEALDAKAVVLQAPRSFRPTPENLARLCRFFEQADRGGRLMAFEPRGDGWNTELLAKLVSDLDLVHVVDPFLREPVGKGLRYFRLHGRPAYHYGYRYTDGDLVRLESLLSGTQPNWVLFNNVAMADDARRFIGRIRSGPARG